MTAGPVVPGMATRSLSATPAALERHESPLRRSVGGLMHVSFALMNRRGILLNVMGLGGSSGVTARPATLFATSVIVAALLLGCVLRLNTSPLMMPCRSAVVVHSPLTTRVRHGCNANPM